MCFTNYLIIKVKMKYSDRFGFESLSTGSVIRLFKHASLAVCVLSFIFCTVSCEKKTGTSGERDQMRIRGWSILTGLPEEITKALDKAKEYDINHLQLSHDIVMDLRETKDPQKRQEVNSLISQAHEAGIEEVIVWDHAPYELDYYPDNFKTGPGGTIDLDNAEFWEWFKKDYRDMMAGVKDVDGLVLTFVRTGARAEQQFSRKLQSEAEKLAEVVNNIAEVVVDELGKKLYIRTFAYHENEYRLIAECIDHFKSSEIILMMKEAPHDFFLTHPNNPLAGKINRPTLIEFDAGNEFNGQGVIANTWPEYVIDRWSDFMSKKNVIGYVARTDRFATTSVIGRPSEILLHALKRYNEDTTVTADLIYDEFITREYGKEALPWVKPAFKAAFDVVASSLYTLGTNVTNHSKLNFDPYPSSYGRHVSGKWLSPPIAKVGHGVDKNFHYWKDVVEHIAPARLKTGGQLEEEVPYVLENGWVTPEERMTEEFLANILTEKRFGVEQARAALTNIEKAKPYVVPHKYNDLYQTFYRTLLTARLYEAVATAYFGYRIYARGDTYRTPSLHQTAKEGLDGILTVAGEMEAYKESYPTGEWNWKKDGATALEYHRKITKDGWPDYGNVLFKEQ